MLAPIRTPQAPGGFPDGIRPVFLEVGAAPTAGNAPYPPGSVVRFGTLYYLNLGTLATPSWAQISTVVAQNLTALSGLAKLTAGVFSAAAAGVDYAKGPWKTFSTVRNVVAAQTLSIPVVDGEGNGLLQAMGRIIGDGSGRVVTLKINGSATNVTQQAINAQGNAAASGITARVGAQTTLAYFVLSLHTAKLGGIRRAGVLTWLQCASGGGGAISQYSSGFHFDDTTTTITTVDLDCGNATGMAAGSEAIVMEGLAG